MSPKSFKGDGGWLLVEGYPKEVIRRNPKKKHLKDDREKEKETKKRRGIGDWGHGRKNLVSVCVLFRSAQLSVAPTAKRLGIFFVLVFF